MLYVAMLRRSFDFLVRLHRDYLEKETRLYNFSVLPFSEGGWGKEVTLFAFRIGPANHSDDKEVEEQTPQTTSLDRINADTLTEALSAITLQLEPLIEVEKTDRSFAYYFPAPEFDSIYRAKRSSAGRRMNAKCSRTQSNLAATPRLWKS